MLKVVGLFDRETRELVEMAYQFERDFVLDSSAATGTFALEPTPLDEALDATATWWAAHVRDAA